MPPGLRPHLSLSGVTCLDVPAASAALAKFARRTPPLSLELEAIGAFPGPGGVVYLAPAPSLELLQLHQAFYQSVLSDGQGGWCCNVNHYYLPGRWMPHITLAMDLPPEAVPPAVAVCRAQVALFQPARLTHLSLISWPPFETVVKYALEEDKTG
jgi:2'-5' RNA ligase